MSNTENKINLGDFFRPYKCDVYNVKSQNTENKINQQNFRTSLCSAIF